MLFLISKRLKLTSILLALLILVSSGTYSIALAAPSFQITPIPPPHSTQITLESGAVLAVGGRYSDTVANFSANSNASYVFDNISLKKAYIKDNANAQWRAIQDAPCTIEEPVIVQLNSNKVLIAGGSITYKVALSIGFYLGLSKDYSNCAGILDLTTETWATISDMQAYRIKHEAVKLNDGRVLVGGGPANETCGSYIDCNSPVNPSYAEVYNPVNKTWTKTGNYLCYPPLADSGKNCVYNFSLQPDGKVRAKTNNPNMPDQVYDPATNQWKMLDAEPGGVYRFVNSTTGGHFFTTNRAERDMLLANYSSQWPFEGVAFVAKETQESGTLPVYRFYNMTTGIHFFTINETEKAWLVANYSTMYKYEGIAYYAYPNSASGIVPVYRFYNQSKNMHHFTANEQEKTIIMQSAPDYKYEGIAYYLKAFTNS